MLKRRSAEAIAILISLKRSLTSLLAAETPEACRLTFAGRFVVLTGYSANIVSHVYLPKPLETPLMRAIEEVMALNNRAAR